MIRTARERRSQSVSRVSTRSAVVHVSLQKRSSVTLPERSRSARQRLAQRRPRPAARLTLRDRQRDLGRREHAANLAGESRERLDEMEVRDHRAIPQVVARQRVDVRPQRVGHVLGDRGRDADEP